MLEIKLYIFIMCLLYVLKMIFDVVMRIVSSNVEPIKLTIYEKVVLLLSLSYILTCVVRYVQ